MKTLLAFLILGLALSVAPAEVSIGKDTVVDFATVEEGRAVLTARDEFVERMSPFDRASRMKTDNAVSEEEYLEFVGKHVLGWSIVEKEKATSALKGVQKELEALSLPLPKRVLIIKTSGQEEGGAAYTRSDAIIFPKSMLEAPIETLQSLICHELFHIISRRHPELRERFYAAIGFVKCGELELPESIRNRKITNPDAPRNEHIIRVEVEDKEQWVIPLIFSKSETYDLQRGGAFFDYLTFKFILVDREHESSKVMPMHEGTAPMLVDPEQVSGFFEQIGRNTGYIIHPEEVLADNFAFLVLGEQDLPSPEIVDKMEQILKEAAVPVTEDESE